MLLISTVFSVFTESRNVISKLCINQWLISENGLKLRYGPVISKSERFMMIIGNPLTGLSFSTVGPTKRVVLLNDSSLTFICKAFGNLLTIDKYFI